MRIRVLKFGGTSVATTEARRIAAARVASYREQGYAPVVVVSAIGRQGDPYATDTLLGLLREVDVDVPPEPREMDLMAACGEILSAVIFSHSLTAMGYPARAFRGGQAGIRTDGSYGRARIVEVKPQSLLRCLADGRIPVVCGFQGVYIGEPEEPGGERPPGAELTTLGRGGSDTTAAALGAALGAEAVEIFTDVDGVAAADPRLIPEAPILRQVSYEEVAEFAHLGASVLHPRAAEIAMKHGIALRVRGTFSDDAGTEVVPAERFGRRRITGVAHTGKLVTFTLDLSRVEPAEHASVGARVFRLLEAQGVGLHVGNVTPGRVGFSFRKDRFGVVEEALDGLVAPLGSGGFAVFCVGERPSARASTQLAWLGGGARPVSVGVAESCALISIVGRDAMGQPGVLLKALAALHRADVTVFQTSDSEDSLSCLVPEADVQRGVRALFDAFELAEVR